MATFSASPIYITFTHNYFSTEELSGPGTQPGSNRGIPDNLDIISFDWYSNGTDGSSKRNIEELVKPTVEKIKAMNSTIPILLTTEAMVHSLMINCQRLSSDIGTMLVLKNK